MFYIATAVNLLSLYTRVCLFAGGASGEHLRVTVPLLAKWWRSLVVWPPT